MNPIKRIILPPSLLADLYKEVLVAENKVPSAERTDSPRSVKVIVIASEKQHGLPDSSYSFLQNVLKACKIDLSETAVITASSPLVNGGLTVLKASYQSPVILLFGLNPTILALPVHFPAFQVQAYDDCLFLWAPELEEIAADKSLKATLWKALQKIFNL